MSVTNLTEACKKEIFRLDKLIKEKEEGEFTKFPIFFPLSSIFLPKEGDPGKTVIQVGAISTALKNIAENGNRPQEFVRNSDWDILLGNVTTYLCGIFDSEQLKDKDLNKIYLLVDTPSNSDFINEINSLHLRAGRRPCYWAILSPVAEEKEEPVQEEEKPELVEEGTEQPAEQPEESVEEAPEPTPEQPAEEPVAVQEQPEEEPQKDA